MRTDAQIKFHSQDKQKGKMKTQNRLKAITHVYTQLLTTLE